MTFVISQGCCRDASCVSVCPVQCIRPRPGDPEFETSEQLYIDPAVCIDCGACVEVCPVDAIHPEFELPAELGDYLEINADYFASSPDYDRVPVRQKRPRLPDTTEQLRVAVVGAGPAACYVITDLATMPGVAVTVFDRQPTPFGLIRSGVAPDHPHTKRIGERFGDVLARSNVHCFFNVDVGTDITVAELFEYHHAVIVATGAQDDRMLGIPGEDLPGSHAAKDFVTWYNGRPDHSTDDADLSGDRAVVIGNGNVALDIARVLLGDPQTMARTDIAEHALEALRHSKIREVILAGRRGPESAACSAGELRELSKLDDVDLTVTCDADELDHFESTLDYAAGETRKRRSRIIRGAVSTPRTPERKQVDLRFLSVPVSINGSEQVESITFARQRIDRSGEEPLLVDTGETETIQASLVVRAIGFSARPPAGLPVDSANGTITNQHGRVFDPETEDTLSGLYCAGWVKRGPSGVIGSNKVCAEESVGALIDDFAAGKLTRTLKTCDELASLVKNRVPSTVGIEGWQRIDAVEREKGQASGRTRLKLVTIEDMLAVAHGR